MHTKHTKFRARPKRQPHRRHRHMIGATMIEVIVYLMVIAFVASTFFGNIKGIFDTGSREMVKAGLLVAIQGANACLRASGALPATSAAIITCSGGIVKNVNLDPYSNTQKFGEITFTDSAGQTRVAYYSKCGVNSSHTPYYDSTTNTVYYGTYCKPEISTGNLVLTSATWSSHSTDSNVAATGYVTNSSSSTSGSSSTSSTSGSTSGSSSSSSTSGSSTSNTGTAATSESGGTTVTGGSSTTGVTDGHDGTSTSSGSSSTSSSTSSSSSSTSSSDSSSGSSSSSDSSSSSSTGSSCAGGTVQPNTACTDGAPSAPNCNATALPCYCRSSVWVCPIPNDSPNNCSYNGQPIYCTVGGSPSDSSYPCTCSISGTGDAQTKQVNVACACASTL